VIVLLYVNSCSIKVAGHRAIADKAYIIRPLMLAIIIASLMLLEAVAMAHLLSDPIIISAILDGRSTKLFGLSQLL
jgi:hypothetical protein